jgi:hypothetical protein
MLKYGLLGHQSVRGLYCPSRFNLYFSLVDGNPKLLIGKNRAAGQMGVLQTTQPSIHLLLESHNAYALVHFLVFSHWN